MKYKNILFIDDDVDNCEFFLITNEKSFGPVRYNSNNNTVNEFHQLKENQIRPNLVFLDLNMPVMNGIEFLTEIKKLDNLSNIPIIILTNSSLSKLIRQTKALGAHGFITKPNEVDESHGIWELMR